MRRLVFPVLGAAAAAAVIAAAALAVVATLPQPTASDRLGTSVLRFLETRLGHGSRMTIGGDPIVARCRRLSPRRSLVALSDGTAFVLTGSHIRRWKPSAKAVAAATDEPPLLRAAEADLAGSYRLYGHELTAQLELGHRIVERSTTRGGRAVYVVQLASARPRVALVVDSRTMQPVAARFESAALAGRATLAPPGPRRGAKTC